MSRILDLERRTKEIDRREFLDCIRKLLVFGGIAGLERAVEPVGRMAFLSELFKDKPRVIYSGDLRNDFWGIHKYNQNKGPDQYYDPPGVNISYRYGAEVDAPTKGEIWRATFLEKTGNGIIMDCGIVSLTLLHLKEMFVRKGEIKQRGDLIGKEGNTGEYSQGISHVALRLYGNAVIKSDINYDTGEVSEEGLKYGKVVHIRAKEQDDFWKFLIDPDKRTPDGKPLVESPWDGIIDYDTEYYRRVELVNEGFDRFIRDLRGKEIAKSVKELKGLFLTIEPLSYRLSHLWRNVNDHIKENKLNIPNKPHKLTREDGKDLVTRLAFDIYYLANMAAEKFVITSPFKVKGI